LVEGTGDSRGRCSGTQRIVDFCASRVEASMGGGRRVGRETAGFDECSSNMEVKANALECVMVR